MSKRLIVLAIGAILALIVGVQVAAFASHPEVSLTGSDFEIDTDANLKVDDATPSLDWANVTEIRKADTQSGSADESFGNGSKEDTPVPSVVDGGIPPNKSDLKFFGVYQEGSTTNGFLNLYWSRVQEPSGTTNMDFEFNQSTTKSSNGVTPVRTEGDILVQYDLSQGGTNPQLFASRWLTTADPDNTAADCEAANKLPCWGTRTNMTAAGDATGSINTTPIPVAESDGLGAHSARTFGEAQVRLSALIPPGSCTGIASAYLKSRSSDSFTAAMKDFVPPQAVNIATCGKVIIRKQTLPDTDNNTGPQFGYTKSFTTTPTTQATFTLRDDGAQTFNNVAFGTGLTVTEDVLPTNWQFKEVDCSASTGVTVNTNAAPLITFDIDSATDVVDCTYTNELRTTSIASEQSFIPQDKATITGNPTTGFNGTVAFRLYSGSNCAGTALYEDTDNALTNGTAQTDNDGVPAADDGDAGYTIAGTGGNFSWKVNYIPAQNEVHPASETCKEVSTVTIDNDNTTP